MAIFGVCTIRAALLDQRGARRIAVGLLSTLAALVIISFYYDVKMAHHESRTGIDFAAITVVPSPLGRAVRELPTSALAASDPQAVYWLSGRGPILQIPTIDAHSDNTTEAGDMRRLEEALGRGPVDLIYFNNPAARRAFSPSVLARTGFRCTEIGRYRDGSIFQCRQYHRP
jgi:Flp pilus assembly pilin Flp